MNNNKTEQLNRSKQSNYISNRRKFYLIIQIEEICKMSHGKQEISVCWQEVILLFSLMPFPSTEFNRKPNCGSICWRTTFSPSLTELLATSPPVTRKKWIWRGHLIGLSSWRTPVIKTLFFRRKWVFHFQIKKIKYQNAITLSKDFPTQRYLLP